MTDVDGPEWLSPLLLVALCTSCVGLAAAGAILVGVAGAYWANVGVGVVAGGLFAAWITRGFGLLGKEDGREVDAGTEAAEDPPTGPSGPS